MKTLLILSSCVAAAVATMAQGTVNFANYVSGSIDAPITDASGTALDSSYLVQLYAGASESSLAPVGSAINITTSGYFKDNNPIDTGLPGQSPAYLQVRAWSGSVASYDLASTTPGLEFGKSAVLGPITLGGPGASGPPAVPVNLTGLQGFQLSTVAIPEPSVLALGFLGAGLLFLRRRR
jgi:hypothetical protein